MVENIIDEISTASIVNNPSYTELEKQMDFLKLNNRKAYNKIRKQNIGKFSDTVMKRLKK